MATFDVELGEVGEHREALLAALAVVAASVTAQADRKELMLVALAADEFLPSAFGLDVGDQQAQAEDMVATVLRRLLADSALACLLAMAAFEQGQGNNRREAMDWPTASREMDWPSLLARVGRDLSQYYY